MKGVGAPELLIDASVSPHHYSLRPSAARALDQADLIIWVGPELESFLIKQISTLDNGRRTLALLDQSGVTVYARRNNHTDHTHSDVPKDRQRDPHIWLDPLNVIAVAQVITKVLGELDREHAPIYMRNLTGLIERVSAAHEKISGLIAPIAHKSYVVTHDAFQYFEKRYKLHQTIYLSHVPTILPGAKSIAEVRARMTSRDAHCVFAEPQSGANWIPVLSEGKNVRTGILDPLGKDLRDGDGIEVILLRLAGAITSCLASSP